MDTNRNNSLLILASIIRVYAFFDCQPNELRGAVLVAPVGSGITVLETNNTNECILIARIAVARDANPDKALLLVNKGQTVVGTASLLVKEIVVREPIATPPPVDPTPGPTSTTARDEQLGITPLVEVSGGYSYARIDLTDIKHINSHGWSATITGNINRYFGIEGDFSSQFGSIGSSDLSELLGVDVTGLIDLDIRTYTVMAGPRFSLRNETATTFFHALFGVSRLTASVDLGNLTGVPFDVSIKENAFTMALGGGIDVNVNPRIAIRPLQADYVLTRFQFALPERETQNNLRLSAGVVFRFGR